MITEFTYMATGTGATAEATTDTALVSENTLYGGARVSVTGTFTSPGTITWSNLFVSSGALVIREAGIFSATKMLMRHVWSDNKSVPDGESLEISMSLTLLRS